MTAILETKHIVMRFGGLTAVDDFNFAIHPDEIVAIIGPNGAGKTTVFNVITGVYKPAAGTVHFMAEDSNPDLPLRDITGLRPDIIAKLGISRTFQNIRLFAGQTALENVLLGQHVHLKSSLLGAITYFPNYYKEERAMRKRAMELLDALGIADMANAEATSLPYGLQRRLEIARALAARPKLLLLDEPAAGMNPQETEELTLFVRQIRDQHKTAILIIEHHMDLVMEVAERICVLDFGKTIAEGFPDEIQNNPAVITAYLGADDEDA